MNHALLSLPAACILAFASTICVAQAPAQRPSAPMITETEVPLTINPFNSRPMFEEALSRILNTSKIQSQIMGETLKQSQLSTQIALEPIRLAAERSKLNSPGAAGPSDLLSSAAPKKAAGKGAAKKSTPLADTLPVAQIEMPQPAYIPPPPPVARGVVDIGGERIAPVARYSGPDSRVASVDTQIPNPKSLGAASQPPATLAIPVAATTGPTGGMQRPVGANGLLVPNITR